METKAKEISLKRLEHIQELIRIAQGAEGIKQDICTEILADMIYSVFIGLCLTWRTKEFKFSLRSETMQAIQLLLDALSNEKE